ncbi:MAG: uspa protein [Pedosphaera sp.]|nr:uspa protein [Pedosphaera sp.]
MKIKPAAKKGDVVMELHPSDEQLLVHSFKAAENKGWPFQLKNILVPIDFSQFSRRALEYALPLAERFGATITLFHAVAPVYMEGITLPECGDLSLRMEQEAMKMLNSLGREKIKPEIACGKLTAIGNPWQEIITAALSGHSDLIVIATHGYTGLRHVLMGSTAERVVRHAPCPVMVVRARENAGG